MRPPLLVASSALFLVLSLVLSGPAAFAQSLASRPVDDVPGSARAVSFPMFGDSEQDAWNLARDLARRTGVAFGVETVMSIRPHRVMGPRRLELAGRTLGELLDAFVARDPRYEWREEMGVINIRPVETAGDPRNPLNRVVEPQHLADIDIHHAMDSARAQFAPAPAAVGRGGRFALTPGPRPGDEWSRQRFSVDFPGGTLLELLNAIVLARGACWHVAPERAADGEWQGGQLSVATLAGNATFGRSLPGPVQPPRRADAAAAPTERGTPHGVASAGAVLRPPGSLTHPGVAAPSRADRPRMLVVGLPLDDVRLAIGLQMVSQTTGTSIGFEWKPSTVVPRFNPPEPGGPSLDLAGMDAREAVSRLLREAPDYEMFEADGVIEVSPLGARADPDNILNQVVPVFEIENATIQELPAAVHAIWRKSSPTPPPQTAPTSSDEAAKRTTLSLVNRTVREILNAIVATRGRTMWDVRFQSAGPVYDRMSIGFHSDGYGVSVGGPAKR